VTGYFTWLQFQATQRKDYSDQFVKATEMLANSSPTTRLAGAAILRSLVEAGASPTDSAEKLTFLDLFVRTNAAKRNNNASHLGSLDEVKPAPEIQEILDLYRSAAYRRVRTVAPADFRGSDLTGANFAQARLNGARFYNAILRASYFYEAELRAADFSNANLSSIPEIQGAQTILSCAELENANFSNAMLDGAVISHADLQKAHFGGASLKGVQFSDANISGADFRGADVADADLSHVVCSDRANFESAKNLDKEKFPKNPSCPSNWALLPFCKPIGLSRDSDQK
jgi:hypothetical protein